MRLAASALAIAFALLLAACSDDTPQQAPPAGGGSKSGNTLLLQLKDGPVTIELLPEIAPRHVERIKTLTRQGFYNGVIFHRVIDG
ncbi:MAG: peptidylprolyl isomerase, partial [Rhodobiaceae bacterium]|nr:peptidylprolyl isomerase [Rhodobiaceae bacterium]